MYPVFRTRSSTYTCGHPRMRVPTCFAHNDPRRIDDPPSASRPRWRAARAGKAAHTSDNRVTRAVFHAPMSALNVVAVWNACEPNPQAIDADGKSSHVSARMRARPIAHAHTRAHGGSMWARVCGGPASAIRSSR